MSIEESKFSDLSIPQKAIWIFSGTADGNALANEAANLGYPIVLSVATEYGRQMAVKTCPQLFILSGKRGIELRKHDLIESHALAILDATHPYAIGMSQQLINLGKELLLPYIRYERPAGLDEDSVDLNDDNVHAVESIEAAALTAMRKGKKIFLATGSKDLPTFLNSPNAAEFEWFARITPEPELLKRALELGIPVNRICAMQGPFSQAFNEALWRDWQIDCVVTKDSGDAGGYTAKANAAAKLKIPFVVVKRPMIEYPFVASDFSEVLKKLQATIHS